ncbi:MAG: phosphodiesterase [Oscillospiraceae bacterium]|nr:phosphodiesterase [Oscillospiraceae bacterium]
MKWLIASDIHGSAYYCRALLAAYRREQAERMLLLGDILYHGPRNDLPQEYDPKAVAAMLNPLAQEILCVRGNCDSEVDQMMLDFPILAEYALIAEGSTLIFATHGHHYHADALPPLHDGDILLHGHTHVPVCQPSGNVMVLNPGSVSIPKEGSAHSYMILENGAFTWKSLGGEPYRTWQITKAHKDEN